jgi:hypothetical protein
VLVWQADTRSMNAVVPQGYIDRHIAEDAARAAAEYGAQFRTDIEALVAREAVQACVSVGTYERPRERGISYTGFVDPSGGSADSFALGVGHTSYENYPKQSVIIDCLREVRPPFSPEVVTQEFAKVLKSYRISGRRSRASFAAASAWNSRNERCAGDRFEH